MTNTILSPEQFIADYLEKIKFPIHNSIEEFEEYLFAHHPERTVKRILKMMGDRQEENGSIKSNIYRRKNEYLRLSLDVASFAAD
jgi:hypothetical protein